MISSWREVAEIVAGDPDVGADAIADGPAEELVNRDAVELADDVPERDVDGRLRAREDGAASQEAGAANHLPVRLDPGRILTDQIAAEIVHRCLDGLGSELHAGLSPARDPFVGADPDERPLRRADECVDGGDLHVRSPSVQVGC